MAQLVATGGGDDLTNKAYVDAKATGYLPLAGGAKIVQPLAPVAAKDLANKAYVDAQVSTPGTIPGTSIVNNSITNTRLAPGSAAANINTGPDGSILPSKISGGPFLLLSGGTMSGAISQPIAPVAANLILTLKRVKIKIFNLNFFLNRLNQTLIVLKLSNHYLYS